MKRLLSSMALALVATLALAGCGSNSSSSPSGSSGFNQADVTFAQSMIPHHQQAVQMANMAMTHASAPEVKALAAKIAAAQSPEISTMSGWLKGWGKEVPSGSMSGMDHGMGGMGSGAMPGMMSFADMKKLDAATGAGFDRMWLTMMIAHHTGAIAMAETEQAKGQNADAMALAQTIQAAQTAEIAKMKALLNS